MTPKWRYLTLVVIFLIPLCVSLVSKNSSTTPMAVEIICDVDSVTSALTNSSIEIPVFVTNLIDSVAGFELWLNMSDPELVRFVADSTVGSVTYAKYSNVGTRTDGWQFMAARILDANHGVLKISGTADQPGPPLKKPIPPGSGVLVKLYAETVGTLGDSLCDSVSIKVLIDQGQTRFSNPDAQIIGCNYHWEVDTFYFNCAQYILDSCVAWFDTIIDSTNVCVIDTTKRILLDGAVGFGCCTWEPGDADGSGGLDISDAVYLIQFIFQGGPPPQPRIEAGDMDCSGGVDISDAVYMIQYIFQGGPPAPCTCSDLT
jgi:hypothetical protein